MNIIDVRTAAGMDVTLVPDRGLDIGDLFYKGTCLSFITPNGLTSSTYYDPHGIGWLDAFSGGMLTTCGLSSLGPPGEDDGEELGQHGRYSSIPAAGVAVEQIDEDGQPCFRIRGTVEECRLAGRRLRLERTVVVNRDVPRISVRDTVRNYGYEPSPFTILYHMNTGYPLLRPGSTLYVSSASVEPKTDAATAHSGEWDTMREPTAGAPEELFIHRITPRDGRTGHALLVSSLVSSDAASSPAAGTRGVRSAIGLHIRFDSSALPYLCEWKLMKSGEYVLGIEPGNVPVAPRAALREQNLLPILAPGETRSAGVNIEIVEGHDAVQARVDAVADATPERTRQ